METQGIYFTGIVRHAADVVVLPGREGSRGRSILYRLRKRYLSNLDLLYPPGTDSLGAGAILKAMLLGDNEWLSPESTSAFQETGTYHVLVVAAGLIVFHVKWNRQMMRKSDLAG